MKNITAQIKARPRAYNMTSSNGNDVPNQIIIETQFGRMFRSYNSNIAFIPNDENVIYLGEDWDYSRTTAKYRNAFLGVDTQELKRMIADGRAVLKPEL